jgi:vitamin B12 transporter
MSSNNTLVLFNEARVNDLRSGSFDLSQIGLGSIDKVEYYMNNSEGYSAAGGVVKFTSGVISNKSSVLIGTKIDNLRSNTFYGKINIASGKTTYSFNFDRAYSPNNYKFVFEDKSLERLNADYSKFFISNSVNHLYNKGFVKFYIHYSTISNGLPGFVANNNYNSSLARASNKTVLSVVNYFHQFSTSTSYKSTVSFNSQKINMFDPNRELLVSKTETQNSLSEASLNNYVNSKLFNTNVKIGFGVTYSRMNSTLPRFAETTASDLTSRYSGKVFAGISHEISLANIIGKMRFNANGALITNRETSPVGKTKNVFSNYKIGVDFSPEIDDKLIFNLFYASNFREPTFSEIYYSGLFSNSNLKGEKYYSTNLSAGYSFSSNTSANLSIYSIIGKDKIVWLPTRLAFQIPRNFKSIKSSGLEFSLNSNLIPEKLSFGFIYVYNNSINTYYSGDGDNSYNKQLIYSPKNRISFKANLNLTWFEISSDFTFVDKRFYTSDNNPRFTLPAYSLVDISFSKLFRFSNVKFRATMKIYNLTNQNYFVIQSYPMPLRTFMIDLQTVIE